MCAKDNQGQEWIVMQQRGHFVNGEQYFVKTFAEYQEGFGMNSEVWLGLENLSMLTARDNGEL